MDPIAWLQQWYSAQCNGDWEHTYGIQIETLDNPGWSVKIDLNGTRYAELPNVNLKDDQKSDSEWMVCKVVDGVYQGTGGPLMLGRILQVFRSWVEEF